VIDNQLDITASTIEFTNANYAIGIGFNSAPSTGTNNIALGVGATTNTLANNISIGTNATCNPALVGSCIAIGAGAVSSKNGSQAFGDSADATGTSSISIGKNSLASGEYSLAICDSAEATALNTIAIGPTAKSYGEACIAIGNGAIAGAIVGYTYCTSIGGLSSATGFYSTAIGYDADSTAQEAFSIGYLTKCSGLNSMVIGNRSTCTHTNSIVIGRNISSGANNQIVLGSGTQFIDIAGVLRLGSGASTTIANQTLVQIGASQLYNLTTVAATGTLGSVLTGTYLISATAAIAITLPTISATMVGFQLTFRKTAGLGVAHTISCSTGNTYLPLNSITATAAGTFTSFIAAAVGTARVVCISATQWAVG
jgi:hypothetical protein